LRQRWCRAPRWPRPRWFGAADDTTGQAIWAFVILRQETVAEADEEGEGDALGAEVAPACGQGDRGDRTARQIMIVPELPKTRSGTIMRRLLKDVAEHREVR
jgi:acetyl-CoA synthetase